MSGYEPFAVPLYYISHQIIIWFCRYIGNCYTLFFSFYQFDLSCFLYWVLHVNSQIAFFISFVSLNHLCSSTFFLGQYYSFRLFFCGGSASSVVVLGISSFSRLYLFLVLVNLSTFFSRFSFFLFSGDPPVFFFPSFLIGRVGSATYLYFISGFSLFVQTWFLLSSCLLQLLHMFFHFYSQLLFSLPSIKVYKILTRILLSLSLYCLQLLYAPSHSSMCGLIWCSLLVLFSHSLCHLWFLALLMVKQ